jgi:hypothetical protein
MDRFAVPFAMMSDVQFGMLMVAITAITVAAFYFHRRLKLETPVMDIDTEDEKKIEGGTEKPKAPRKRKKKSSRKKPQGEDAKAAVQEQNAVGQSADKVEAQ